MKKKLLLNLGICLLITLVVSSFRYQKNDRIEVIFNRKTTFEQLVKIQSDLKNQNIDLKFSKLRFDETDGLLDIKFQVDCNDGFSGSAEDNNLSNQSRFGFYRDYSSKKSPFGTGELR
jgi:hypothetical protein